MYERNAIVLERYFDKIFKLSEVYNLRENYLNYRKLIENFERYSLATVAEKKAVEEFDEASREIVKLQKMQEKLYNKGAKYEYSRYIIYTNIKETPENIQKCLAQVELDIEKNNNALNELDDKFVTGVKTYNEKKCILEKCQREKNDAKSCFETILEKTWACYKNLSEEYIQEIKDFITSENKENKKELSNIFLDNGKNERTPFDNDVIQNAISVSISIYKIEMDIYITGYDRTAKLLTELETDTVKVDKHKKYYNDSKMKLDFLMAQKDYLVQFLDNERIAAIYDKKTHRKLMLEACRGLNSDLEQINKLYEILLKEMAGRFTKKLYKENYNREYLSNLEETSYEAEKPNVRTNTIAVMNLNYWRIEGIRRIYEAFDESVIKYYGRDLSEFIPENERVQSIAEALEDEDDSSQEFSKLEENQVGNTIDIIEDSIGYENVHIQKENSIKHNENKIKRKSKYGILKSSKKTLANAIYISLQTHEFGTKAEDARVIANVNSKENFEENTDFDNTIKFNQSIDIDNNINISDDLEEKIDSLDIFGEDLDDDTQDFGPEFELDDIDELDDFEEENTEKIGSTTSIEENIIDNIQNFHTSFNEAIETNDKNDKNDKSAPMDNISQDIEDEMFENTEEDEESILDLYFSEQADETKKRKIKDERKIEEINNTSNIFKRLINMNSRKRKKA